MAHASSEECVKVYDVYIVNISFSITATAAAAAAAAAKKKQHAQEMVCETKTFCRCYFKPTNETIFDKNLYLNTFFKPFLHSRTFSVSLFFLLCVLNEGLCVFLHFSTLQMS